MQGKDGKVNLLQSQIKMKNQLENNENLKKNKK